MQCLCSESSARADSVCEEKETPNRALVSNMVELSWYEVDKVLGRGNDIDGTFARHLTVTITKASSIQLCISAKYAFAFFLP
jgi:hypothetical protein